MNRLAKGFRVVSGVLVLLNIMVFFLPIVQCERENYPTKTWSQLNYIMNVMGNEAPYGTDFTVSRLIWVVCFIIVPLLLVLITGILGIVGNDRQIVSSILSFVVLALYIGLVVSIKSYLPDETYSRGMAGNINLICSGLGVLTAIIALIVTPRKEEMPVMMDIPQVMEIKQQQVEARYNIITEKSEQSKPEQNNPEQTPPVEVPQEPRGVMVGLAGIYAGAEIPFKNGECIKIGRLIDNDLVFEGQEKVSRNHCYIKWDANDKKFLLCDFSSNGTFVNGSDECLPQNLELPMEPGTIIAIGDEKNTFRLE